MFDFELLGGHGLRTTPPASKLSDERLTVLEAFLEYL
jgi:hypothetical protein